MAVDTVRPNWSLQRRGHCGRARFPGFRQLYREFAAKHVSQKLSSVHISLKIGPKSSRAAQIPVGRNREYQGTLGNLEVIVPFLLARWRSGGLDIAISDRSSPRGRDVVLASLERNKEVSIGSPEIVVTRAFAGAAGAHLGATGWDLR